MVAERFESAAVPPTDQRLGSRRQMIAFFDDPRVDSRYRLHSRLRGRGETTALRSVTALEHVRANTAKALG